MQRREKDYEMCPSQLNTGVKRKEQVYQLLITSSRKGPKCSTGFLIHLIKGHIMKLSIRIIASVALLNIVAFSSSAVEPVENLKNDFLNKTALKSAIASDIKKSLTSTKIEKKEINRLALNVKIKSKRNSTKLSIDGQSIAE